MKAAALTIIIISLLKQNYSSATIIIVAFYEFIWNMFATAYHSIEFGTSFPCDFIVNFIIKT